MSSYICDYGHINKSEDLHKRGEHSWRCLTCGGRLETSPAIEALCARYLTRTFKVVECEFEETTIQFEQGAVVKGPIEDVLLIVFPAELLQSLVSTEGSITRFAGEAIQSVKDAGWDGEVLFISDDMKLARFEMEEL